MLEDKRPDALRVGCRKLAKRNRGLPARVLAPRSKLSVNLLEAGPFSPMRDVIGGTTGIIQGIRFEGSSKIVNVKNTIISLPRTVVSRLHWEVIAEETESLRALSHYTGAEVEIPRSALAPAARSASGQETMEIVSPTDFAVVERFRDDGQFWGDPNPEALLGRRRPHLDSRKGRLLISGRNHVDLVSNSTHFLAFCVKEPVIPTWNFWSVRTVNWDAAKILCLWLNSIFAITHLYDRRITGEGTYVGWLKSDLLNLPVPQVSALRGDIREGLLRTFPTNS